MKVQKSWILYRKCRLKFPGVVRLLTVSTKRETLKMDYTILMCYKKMQDSFFKSSSDISNPTLKTNI